ncbi:hypothetical protein, partial [Pseudomonas sp. SIMBA_021]
GKSRARLAQIDRAADSMRERVNVLLMLAREDSVRDVEPVGLVGLIWTALTPLADRLADRGIEPVVDVAPSTQIEANRSALA